MLLTLDGGGRHSLESQNSTYGFGAIIGTITSMPSVEKLLEQMRSDQVNIRFADLRKVCDAFFGKPRHTGSSHVVYRMPWPGDPRVNIQNDRGRAKVYQIRQVLAAIDKLQREGK